MRVIGVNLIVSKRILESFPTFYPGQDYLLVRCTNGGASDRIVWVHVQYLIKKWGVTLFVLLQRVSGGGDLSSIWK